MKRIFAESELSESVCQGAAATLKMERRDDETSQRVFTIESIGRRRDDHQIDSTDEQPN
jgi:hypothetical protein